MILIRLLPSRRQTLALQMALAVLQLHDTPWLDASFHTKNIVFHTEKSALTTSLLEPAYVSRSFSQNQVPEVVTSVGRQLTRNTLLFALGVMLLELSYGKPLTDHARPDELDANGEEIPATELLVAQRLLRDIEDRETPNYSLATASCINCDVGQPLQSSLNHDEFRAGFIDCVVERLRDDYAVLFS